MMLSTVRALLILTLLTGCATSRPSEPFRVMTYNIRLNLASDGPDAWPHRKDAVAQLVLTHNADLLGVQEALPEQLSDLDAGLPGFSRFGAGRNAQRSGEHTAIFYRASRFELIEEDTFWLSETPAVAGSKSWDAAYERIATWGRLRDRGSGTILYVFNTHFDHIGVIARRESARLLTAEINRIAGRSLVILMGDFNDVAASDAYTTIVRDGFQDSMTVSKVPARGPDSTWNAFRAIEPGRRIDFIFVRGSITVLKHETVNTTREDGRFPSDHLPVVAEVVAGAD
jgi:endonuclease/exonuclease/phosphatase family metal-dependent hydrolase